MFRRLVLPALLALCAFVLAPNSSRAVEYPWCAQYSGDGGGGRNCGFSTLQQCEATVSGIGGFCERNSFYTGPERTQPKPRKRNSR
ncbi:DUF3551 domain-containing protein [Pseudolabrys taiwanensis]|uniref:DUF3551 domain-containing protein n=1 Tax=Pseudolabrys taiwanensis TaxID=331696 RepID=A0A345ZS89_9HYPH|nr:DUF3551 domain-containing protein [Pseudolabrys taiwanensis]AXK79786.1 DUF3551 domain-containing protein [Pseudolabrys taiwanensis]